jgi:FkbM family methyltransferase
MNDLKSRLGLLRSKLIYLWNPLHQSRLRRFYSQFVQPGALCFDIGAHLGDRSRVFLDLGARVIAVEPQHQCVDYLHKRLGGDQRFTVIPEAVGSKPGRANLHINRMNPAISSLASNGWRAAMAEAALLPERWDRPLEVKVTTLDRLVAEYGLPSFCKIDVEGSEALVLAGLSSPLPALSFEFISLGIADALSCLQRLASLGRYRFNWSFVEKLRLESAEWMDQKRVAQILDGLGRRVISGDIYARLDV